MSYLIVDQTFKMDDNENVSNLTKSILSSSFDDHNNRHYDMPGELVSTSIYPCCFNTNEIEIKLGHVSLKRIQVIIHNKDFFFAYE